jgi:hypothetical protein
MPKICVGEKIAISTNGTGKTGFLPAEDWKLDSSLSTCASINSKWIKDLKDWQDSYSMVENFCQLHIWQGIHNQIIQGAQKTNLSKNQQPTE